MTDQIILNNQQLDAINREQAQLTMHKLLTELDQLRFERLQKIDLDKSLADNAVVNSALKVEHAAIEWAFNMAMKRVWSAIEELGLEEVKG
mgnify:CR=1 FL=1